MPPTRIKRGRLYGGMTDELKADREILVKDGVIPRRDRRIPLSGGRAIGLSRATMAPGLIDAHNRRQIF